MRQPFTPAAFPYLVPSPAFAGDENPQLPPEGLGLRSGCPRLRRRSKRQGGGARQLLGCTTWRLVGTESDHGFVGILASK